MYIQTSSHRTYDRKAALTFFFYLSGCQPGVVILKEFALPSGETWFVKLDACIPLDMFAVGNSWGQVRYLQTI
jgi:hypothetical protein